MIKDLLKNGAPNLKHSGLEEKYLSHKQKKQPEPKVRVHKSLDEELKPLTLMNKSVSQLNGVKGLFIEEVFMLSNMFSWNTSNVFQIYEADARGQRIDPNSQPILYAVAKLQECCTCDCSVMGASQIAITTKLDDTASNTPYLFLKEKNQCCGFTTCDIAINDNGNGTSIGTIKQGYCNNLTVTSEYLNNLQITRQICQCSCTLTNYKLEDGDNNKGVLFSTTNICNCSNPLNYQVGFPSSYDTDENTIILSSVIYLGFVNYQSRQKSSHSSSRH